MEITDEMVSSMFISDRDGQEYVVRWGLTLGMADHAMIFETEGVEGNRLVGFALPRELDDSEHEGYLSGKLTPESFGGGDAGIPLDEQKTDGE